MNISQITTVSSQYEYKYVTINNDNYLVIYNSAQDESQTVSHPATDSVTISPQAAQMPDLCDTTPQKTTEYTPYPTYYK